MSKAGDSSSRNRPWASAATRIPPHLARLAFVDVERGAKAFNLAERCSHGHAAASALLAPACGNSRRRHGGSNLLSSAKAPSGIWMQARDSARKDHLLHPPRVLEGYEPTVMAGISVRTLLHQ